MEDRKAPSTIGTLNRITDSIIQECRSQTPETSAFNRSITQPENTEMHTFLATPTRGSRPKSHRPNQQPSPTLITPCKKRYLPTYEEAVARTGKTPTLPKTQHGFLV